jgi:uncharacterized protein YqeY
MALREDLKREMVEAMKAKDQLRLDTIRAIQSAIRYKEIEKKGVVLTEPEIVSVIGTLCKQRRESIDQFQKGGRADLAEKETRELEVLQKYLPAQLSRSEVETKVAAVIQELGITSPADMGRAMKEAMKRLAGQADGKVVSEVVSTLLKK